MGTHLYEDDGQNFYVSMTEKTSATAYMTGPDDDGSSGVRESLRPHDAPPSLAAEVKPNDG